MYSKKEQGCNKVLKRCTVVQMCLLFNTWRTGIVLASGCMCEAEMHSQPIGLACVQFPSQLTPPNSRNGSWRLMRHLQSLFAALPGQSRWGDADGVYQAGVFERELSKHHYCSAVLEVRLGQRFVSGTRQRSSRRKKQQIRRPRKRSGNVECPKSQEFRLVLALRKSSTIQETLPQVKTGCGEARTRKEGDAVESPRSFPGTSLRTPNISAADPQDHHPKTNCANLRTRVSSLVQKGIVSGGH